MDDRAPSGRDERLERIAWVIRLATRRQLDVAPDSWTGILDLAIEERCAALAWMRSGDFIRANAGPGERARWRAFAVAHDAFVRVQGPALRDVTALLAARGVTAIVLKGIPLSMRLYDSAAARTTDDLDLLVEGTRRDVARRALQESGWRSHYSESMLDDCYVREIDGRPIYLELHHALVSELLSHAGLSASRRDRATTPFGVFDVLEATTLPVYLAAHLAKHPYPYLLWQLDFAALWGSMSEEARAEADAIAVAARLSRWLRWAVARNDHLDAAAQADERALRALGFDTRGKCVTHGAREHIHNSDTMVDAARVVGALVWPRHLRGDLSAFAHLTVRRVRARLGHDVRRARTVAA
jgi:hypothetical protein